MVARLEWWPYSDAGKWAWPSFSTDVDKESREWRVAIEASGWEVMLHLVRLGTGLAVVNACCRIPAALTTRPIPELPSIQYHLICRREGLTGAAAVLREHLRAHAEGWRGGERGS